LRNEVFYRASLEGVVGRHFSLFIAGEGRSVSAANELKHQIHGTPRAYRNLESSELLAGLNTRLGMFSMGAYAGGQLQVKSLGSGATVFGVSLGYIFAGRSRTAPLSAAVSENTKEDEKTKVAKEELQPDLGGAFFD